MSRESNTEDHSSLARVCVVRHARNTPAWKRDEVVHRKNIAFDLKQPGSELDEVMVKDP